MMGRILVLCVLTMSFFSLHGQVVSDFSTDADGWTANDFSGTAPQTVVYNASGGNPGGYVSMTTANPQPMYWYAPSKFLGNRAYTSYGETLTFDVLTQAATSGHGPSGDVMLSGATQTIYTNAPVLPSGPSIWTTVTMKLDETGDWHTSSPTGPTASRQTVIDVLSTLATIRIYVSWKTFPSSNTLGALDNVKLNVHPTPSSPPVITSLSTLKAAHGSNVTITGSNFGSAPANNAVYFGKKKATIISASSTSITATVPLGADYGLISVTNLTTHFTTSSQKAFTPMFATGGGARIIKNSFTPDVLFSRTVGWLSHGDINGDGKPEMFASQSNIISIYENISTPGTINTGSFAPRVDMSPSLPSNYVEINTADLDGDGKHDVFFAFRDNPDQGRIGILRNIHSSGPITSGSFATPQEFNVPPYTASATSAADLDGDGRPELLGWGSSCGSMPIYILQNISTVGDINFASPISLPGSNTCGGRYQLADLDLDGKIDIIETTGGAMRVIRNISTPGNLNFEAGFELGDGGNTGAIGDIDNDGRPDIVFASGGMKIFKNVSTPGSLSLASFQGPVTFAGAINTAYLADINGDGKPDVITGTNTGVGVYENVTVDGQINTSSFNPIVAVEAAANATELDVFDIDLDGRADIVSNNGGQGNISVNQNVISLPPTITNVSPLKGSPGTSVTITGTNFGTLVSDNTVYFGAAKGTVTNASQTVLQVTVPPGASYDQVSVAVRGYTIFSQDFFDPTFSGGSSFDGSSFASAFDLTIAQTSDGVTAMDYDGDGIVDLLADNNFAIGVFRTIGAAGVIDATTFATPYTISSSPSHLKGSDLDGDGKPDLMTYSYIVRNSSNAALPNPIAFETQVQRDNNGAGVTRFASSRDLNNDGKVDVTYTSGNSNIYFVENLTNSGPFNGYGLANASMSAVNSITKPAINGYTVVADFDGDGFNDIATTNPATDNISVLLNIALTGPMSTASFTVKGPFAAGDTPQGIAALDFDGDGKIDLAVANSVNSALATVSIFRNTSTPGTISFTQLDFPAAAGATDIIAEDMDGDGKPDLVTMNVNANSFSVFRNTSTQGVLNTNSFAAKVDYTVASQPRGMTIADIDRDMRPDVIITRASTNISIFKNLVPLGPSISFIQQPANVTACENGTAIMQVIATGADNLGYQWQMFNTATSVFDDLGNNSNYSGVTSSTLTIDAITSSLNGKIYRCLVTGDGASPKTSGQAILTVSLSPAPPTASGASSCKGSSLTLTAAGGIDGNYRWYDSPTSQQPINGEVSGSFSTPVIFTTTTFYAAIANTDGCVSTRTSAQASITPLSKPTISSNGTLLCGVNTVTISGPAGATEYHWSNGESSQDIDVSFTGSYSLITEDANGCQSLASDPIVITSGSVPKPVVISDKTRLCEAGDEALLAAPEGFTSYEWSNGESTQTINVSEPGAYNVVVINSSGCRSETSDDIQIGQGAEKPVISVGDDVLVSSPAKSYQWYYGDLAIPDGTEQFLPFYPFQYGVYTVSVVDFSDCTAKSDEFVNLVTAVEEVRDNYIAYPSPFTDVLFVNNDATLHDLTGKIAAKLVKGPNDVSHLSHGLYFVTIESNNEFKTIKVSK